MEQISTTTHESGEYICYICQEECLDEVSPCKCKAPVHVKCLNDFRRTQFNDENINHDKCTICSTDFIIIPYEIHTEEPRRRPLMTSRRNSNVIFDNCYANLFRKAPILFLIANFLCGGYLIKILLVVIKAESGMGDYWEPWNWDHLFSAIIFLMGGFIISDLITLMYKRCCCSINNNHDHYETMDSYESEASDTDDDDNNSDDENSVAV